MAEFILGIIVGVVLTVGGLAVLFVFGALKFFGARPLGG